MPKFPEPPAAAELASLAPEWKKLPKATLLFRLYFRGGRHPSSWNGWRSYGPTSSRFDHHLPPPRPQERAILYCATQGPTCLAEVFQDTRTVDRLGRDPWLVAFQLARPVQLLDLTGSWPTRAGASMAINTGPRPRARRWSQAIYEAYSAAEGLLYASSMFANRPAVALYERAGSALPLFPSFHRPLSDPALLEVLRHAARQLGYGLV